MIGRRASCDSETRAESASGGAAKRKLRSMNHRQITGNGKGTRDRANDRPRVSRRVTSFPRRQRDPITEKVLDIVAAKTGYPREMLDLDFDMEADLGIDTVKQAETFAAIRETFNIPRQDNLKLRDYPTLKRAVEFVRQFRPDLAQVTQACEANEVPFSQNSAAQETPQAAQAPSQASVSFAVPPYADEIGDRVSGNHRSQDGLPARDA